MEAIVISQFPEIADMAAATQQAIPAEVLSDYIPQVDMQIGSAVLFALIGFFLVTGIEILGKAMKHRQAA